MFLLERYFPFEQVFLLSKIPLGIKLTLIILIPESIDSTFPDPNQASETALSDDTAYAPSLKTDNDTCLRVGVKGSYVSKSYLSS